MRFSIGVIDIEVGVGNTSIDSDIVGIALTSIVEDVVEDMHCRGVLATEGTRGGLAGTGIERHRVEVHADVLGERVNPDTRRCQGRHCRTGEGNHIVVNRDTVDVRTFTVVDADASLATRLVVDKIDEVVVDMDMVAIGHIDTRQRLACQGRAGGNAVACDKERVGITDMDTLIPEVENVVIGNRDIVALGVVNRAYSIVTAVEQTVVDGDIVEKNLAPGEIIKIDTGNVVAFQNGMSYEIETVHGFKNVLFGGEGLFLTRITGPGKVILQTQNIKDFAKSISNILPNRN